MCWPQEMTFGGWRIWLENLYLGFHVPTLFHFWLGGWGGGWSMFFFLLKLVAIQGCQSFVGPFFFWWLQDVASENFWIQNSCWTLSWGLENEETYHPITSNPPTHQLGPLGSKSFPPSVVGRLFGGGEPNIKMLAFWRHLYLAIASEQFFGKNNWFLKNLHVDIRHPVHQDGKTHWSYFMGHFTVEITYKHGMPTGTSWISHQRTGSDWDFLRPLWLKVTSKRKGDGVPTEKLMEPKWKTMEALDNDAPFLKPTYLPPWRLTFLKGVWIVSQQFLGVYVAVLVSGTVYLIFGFHRSSQGSNHCHEGAPTFFHWGCWFRVPT